MIFGCVLDLAVGLICIVMGLLLWKKQKVSLLHDYHYKNVKKENIPVYTRLVGVGMILIGVGICIAGVVILIKSWLWWTPLFAGFAAGIIVIHKAQKKYNGSWLG